jgi:ABC-2 type transport system ATP-binding protein
MGVLTHPALAGSAIACLGLTKDYGGGHGLFDLDLEVRRGEVFGFIGANGAGKTTTMRLIMDLIRPDRGSVSVLGFDAHLESLEIKRRVGYLTGELPQYPGVKAGRVVGLLAGLRGGVDPARITSLAERLQLDLGRRFSDLSHGNKQKVGLVTAFMHEPELLVLDEPTLGLDPLMQREVRALIQEAVQEGATCMISSHVLAEIELVCDRIGLIRDGRLIRVGTLEELRSLRAHHLEAILPTQVEPAQVEGMAGISDVTIDDGLLSCTVHGPITPLLAWLADNGAVELDSRELSLEEVFLAEYEPAP